ncbi:MAG: hypothetical protein QGD94_00125 [Planctomycetia bacterium]|nr:hypothetical protein [Planctomycetia bacterium]
MKRPTVITTIGVLGIVFGSMALLMGIAAFMHDFPKVPVILEEREAWDGVLFVAGVVLALLCILFAAFAIIAAVCFLHLRRWARVGLEVSAWLWLAWGLAFSAFLKAPSVPRFFISDDEGGGPADCFEILFIRLPPLCSTVAMLAVGAAPFIVMIILVRRKTVRAAFAEKADSADTEPPPLAN